MIGKKFGRYSVIAEVAPIKHGRNVIRRFLCRCDCGTEKVIRGAGLRSGDSRSCGCYKRDAAKSRSNNLLHGDTRRGVVSPEYRTWQSLKNRCYRIKNSDYSRYGGRGISVCDSWRNSFTQFLADVGRQPSPEHSIERIDNDGNYEPGNVRWATPFEQSRNKRNSRYFESGGKRLCLTDWAKELGVNRRTVLRHVRLGSDLSKVRKLPDGRTTVCVTEQ